ncbi:MAG: dihydrofolate reductase [Calditrichaeota bacterium]|nr:MAG: dihydrofolate reductase [Calditrichota bacterium]
MPLSIIVAMAKNRVIGRENQLPWRLSDDLKLFKKHTMGHSIVMGRKTWESIGRALPGRENIVLTRDKSYVVAGCTVIHSLQDLTINASVRPEIFIIGGASLYAAALPRASRLFLTEVDAEVTGDVYFPEFDLAEWDEQERWEFQKSEKNEFGFVFRILKRR